MRITRADRPAGSPSAAPSPSGAPAGAPSLTRRAVIVGAGALAAPFVIRPARAARQVVCRNPGGAYGTALEKSIYEPFTKETGIEVVSIQTNQAQLVAMVEAKRVEVDFMEISEVNVYPLDERGAFAPIDYKSWKYTDKATIEPHLVKERWVGYNVTGTAITYNTKVLNKATAPQDWSQFFDIERFPHPRMMAAIEALGLPELEFALMADGVPIDKLYPLDYMRALKVFDRIRPKLRKLYKSGAESVQVMSSGEAQIASMWNGRVQAAIEEGVPLAMNWNQALLSVQMATIFKDGPNPDNAQRFLDFALRPDRQAHFATMIPYSSANRDAMKHLTQAQIDLLPTNPAYKTMWRDSEWWYRNRPAIAQAWQKWVLQ